MFVVRSWLGGLIGLFLVGGCLSAPEGVRSPTPSGPEVIASKWPLAQPGNNTFQGQTGKGGGWIALRLDLPPGFLKLHAGKAFNFSLEYAKQPDEGPHWLVYTYAFSIHGGNNSTPRPREADFPGIWAHYGPVAQLPRQVNVLRLASADDAEALLFVLLTDLELRFTGAFLFDDGNELRGPYRAITGTGVKFEQVSLLGPATPPLPLPMSVLVGRKSHPSSGVEGLFLARESLIKPYVFWPYPYRFKFSGGDVDSYIIAYPAYGQTQSLLEGNLTDATRGPNYAWIMGRPSFSFCEPAGEAEYEIAATQAVGTGKFFYVWMQGDPTVGIGLKSDCGSGNRD